MNPIDKACPKCWAKAGEPCVGLRGKTKGLPLAGGKFHKEREMVSPLFPDEEKALADDAKAFNFAFTLGEPCEGGRCGVPPPMAEPPEGEGEGEGEGGRCGEPEQVPAPPVAEAGEGEDNGTGRPLTLQESALAATHSSDRCYENDKNGFVFKQRSTRNISVPLEAGACQELAQSIRTLEEQEQGVKEMARSQIKELKSRREEALRKMIDGVVTDIEVEERVNYKTSTFRVIRLDTGEVHLERSLEVWELQQELPLAETAPETEEEKNLEIPGEPHDALRVPCMSCGVEAGKPCIALLNGAILGHPHPSRVDMARTPVEPEIPKVTFFEYGDTPLDDPPCPRDNAPPCEACGEDDCRDCPGGAVLDDDDDSI